MIEIQDSTNTLTAETRADLAAVASKHRVVANFVSVPSKAELSRQMEMCVTTPNTICIGVDAQHRFTATEFGVDTGVRKTDFAVVARAGNADFRDGRWADGVKAIVSRAEVMSVARTAAVDARPVIVQNQVVRHETAYWPFFLGFGVLAVILGVFVWAWRKRAKAVDRALADSRAETAELASRNLREADREDFDRRLRESSLLTSSPHVALGERSMRAATPVVTPAVSLSASSTGTLRWSPATPAVVEHVVVVKQDPGIGDFAAGMLLGDALVSRRRDPTPEPTYRRPRTPEPEPVETSLFSSSDDDDSRRFGGDSSDTDSSTSGGDTSSIDSSSGGGDNSDF